MMAARPTNHVKPGVPPWVDSAMAALNRANLPTNPANGGMPASDVRKTSSATACQGERWMSPANDRGRIIAAIALDGGGHGQRAEGRQAVNDDIKQGGAGGGRAIGAHGH